MNQYDDECIPTILEGYIQPIHHIEPDKKLDGKTVWLVTNEQKADESIQSVKELKQELNKYPSDYSVMVEGNCLNSSIDCLWDYIFDVDILDNETLIPNNVSFIIVSHYLCF